VTFAQEQTQMGRLGND